MIVFLTTSTDSIPPPSTVVFPSSVSLTADFVVAVDISAEIQIFFQGNGAYSSGFLPNGDQVPAVIPAWHSPISTGIGNSFEIRLLDVSPNANITVDPFTTSLWSTIGATSFSWSFTSSSLGAQSATYTLQIRPIADPMDISSSTISVTITGT